MVSLDDKLLLILDGDYKDSYISACHFHYEKQKHFYCSYHKINFCRDCIKLYHRDDKCCVVDLFDINKLYELNEQNKFKNHLIVKTRNRLIDGKKMRKEEFFIANS